MRKVLGLVGFLVALVAITTLWEAAKTGEIRFLTPVNLRNVLTLLGFYGILSLGQSYAIITGGIDLSVGSLVSLTAVTAAVLLKQGEGLPPSVALPMVLGMCVFIGVFHGLLITKGRIQPFVVTLCGLFFYRGIARVVAEDRAVGFGTAFASLKWTGRGSLFDLVVGPGQASPEGLLQTALSLVPASFLILMILAVAVAAHLHFSAQGRHLFALGANAEAARFSGIRTDRLIVLAYTLCSLLSGMAGLLLAFKSNSVQSSNFGSFYELYAIAGAVLGGCSLRGGVGNVPGVLLGAALIVILGNLVNILGIPSQLEFVVIGAAILAGVLVDEMLRQRTLRRAAAA